MEQNSTMNPREISITVKAQYLPEQSDPDNRQFAFAYTVTIRNTGTASIQLIARHWFITDGDNDVQEVRGLGVVGQQPLLRSGEHFEYTSCATLPTPSGTMRGEYFFVTEDAQFFQAPIPEFALVMPRTLH
jgi:ApaG protein